jgi:hypothetical protein
MGERSDGENQIHQNGEMIRTYQCVKIALHPAQETSMIPNQIFRTLRLILNLPFEINVPE